jgi:hypothetical protein
VKQLIAGIALLAIAGCTGPATPSQTPGATVAIGTPTAAPTAIPTADPTATPSPSPSPSPTPTPTPTPTPSPSPTPSPTISPSPGPTAGSFLGADTLLRMDDFALDANGWGTGELDGATIHAAAGTLRLDITKPQNGFWSTRSVDAEWPVIRATGPLTPSPVATGEEGYFGFLCGSDNDDFYAGLYSTQAGAVIIQVVAGEVSVVTRSDPDLGVTPGTTVEASFECAGAQGGPLELALWLDGRQVASHVAPEGPPVFSRIGVYAEGITPTFSVAVVEASAFGGVAPRGSSPSPTAPRGPTPSPTASRGASPRPTATAAP